MKNYLYLICCVSILSFGLVGCVPHLSKNQCLNTDWKQVGFSDGSQDHNPRDLSQAIQDCAEFNIKVDTHAYDLGWHKGLRRFCMPGNAYDFGVNGQYYKGNCPSDLASRFIRSYQHGLRRYCVPGSGYQLGRSGKPLPDFCSPDLKVAFNNAYNSGRRIFNQLSNLNNQLNNANTQISQDQTAIDNNNKIIKDAYSEIDQYRPLEHGSTFYRDQIRADYHKIDQAKNQNYQLQRNIDRMTDVKEGIQQQITAIQQSTD